jgi:hypothetical protein
VEEDNQKPKNKPSSSNRPAEKPNPPVRKPPPEIKPDDSTRWRFEGSEHESPDNVELSEGKGKE